MPPTDECLQSVKNSLINNVSVLEMLDDDPLEQCRCHARIPHALGINDDNRSIGAHAEARRLPALHPRWPKEKVFPLQQLGEQGVDLTAAPIR